MNVWKQVWSRHGNDRTLIRRLMTWGATAGLLVTSLLALAVPAADAATQPFKVVFEANNNFLAGFNSTGSNFSTTLGMMAGTSPSVAELADGSFEAAFEANNDYLGLYHVGGGIANTTLGMASGTSPAIAALPGGGWVAAFQANTGKLGLYESSGAKINTDLGMYAGTSPAVVAQSDGSFKVLFQANTGDLAGYNSSGSNFSTTVGMKAGTSPSLEALSDGTYVGAVEANTNDLTTVHISTSGYTVNNTTLGMYAGTSPAISIPPVGTTPVSSVAASIVKLAVNDQGKGAGTCSKANNALNYLGGTSFYTSCTSSTTAEYWCADFAKWVWANSGVNVTGLTPAAGSFIADASQNGSTVHTSSSYAPQVGDAVVYDYNSSSGYAQHVGIVTAVNSDGSIATENGDFGDTSNNGLYSLVVEATIASGQKAVGDTPSSVGLTISAYVTPSGLN